MLETGYEASTPTGDTLIRRFLVNMAASTASPVTAMGGRALEREEFVAADLGRPAAYFNWATLRRPLAPPSTERVIRELNAFYDAVARNTGGTFYLCSAWPTPDLRPSGWSLDGHPPLLYRPAGGAPPPAPAGLRVAEVRDATALAAAERALLEGFEVTELLPVVAGSLLDERVLRDPRLRLWVGWEGEQPVSAAATFIEAGLNQVTAVATVLAARRRGYGEALTWRATLADPSLPAALIASDPGRPVYERMGYIPITRFTLWHRTREPETGAPPSG
ncbi:MAG: GNAT family N-acetyltransferase [Chloroflexota bacterium]|nr:GNAT family N-acetyltransferase [Chloroflexota bacterium]